MSKTLKCPNCGSELPELVDADEATEITCPQCKQVVKAEPVLDPETPTLPKLRVVRVTNPVYHIEPEAGWEPEPESAVDVETPQDSRAEPPLVSHLEQWSIPGEPPAMALPEEQVPVVMSPPVTQPPEDWPTVVEPPTVESPPVNQLEQWPPVTESPTTAQPEDWPQAARPEQWPQVARPEQWPQAARPEQWPTAPLEAAPPSPVSSSHLFPPTAAPSGDVGATRPISPRVGWERAYVGQRRFRQLHSR